MNFTSVVGAFVSIGFEHVGVISFIERVSKTSTELVIGQLGVVGVRRVELVVDRVEVALVDGDPLVRVGYVEKRVIS